MAVELDFSGWGAPETRFEYDRCAWLLAQMEEVLDSVPEEMRPEFRIAKKDFARFPQRVAMAVDDAAKTFGGFTTKSPDDILFLQWREMPSFQDLNRRKPSQQIAHPFLLEELVGFRLNELRYFIESEKSLVERHRLFSGEETPQTFLLGAMSKPFQNLSTSYLAKHREKDAPVVALVSGFGMMRNQSLNEMSTAVRFGLSHREGPHVEGGTLQFNTDHLWTWGVYQGNNGWEDWVAIAIYHAFDESERSHIDVYVPLDLVGDGKYLAHVTNGRFDLTTEQYEISTHYPFRLMTNRPAQFEKLPEYISKHLEEFATALVTPHPEIENGENRLLRGVKVERAPLKGVATLNYNITFTRGDGRTITVKFFSERGDLRAWERAER